MSSLHVAPLKPHIWSVLQSRPSTSSGTGITYWSGVHQCPRRAAFDEAAGERESTENQRVGQLYHALHEFHSTPVLRDEYVIDMTDGDFAFKEACRLFTGYMNIWGPDCWGPTIATEVPFIHPEIPGLTGRIDAVVDCPGAMKRGLILEPGIYLVDHKSSTSRFGKEQYDYPNSMQCLAYMSAWNLLMPDRPCRGMIFDCVYRHKEITVKSFDAFLAVPSQGDLPIVQNFIEQGKQLKEANWCFTKSCVTKYGPCPYLLDKTCPRR